MGRSSGFPLFPIRLWVDEMKDGCTWKAGGGGLVRFETGVQASWLKLFVLRYPPLGLMLGQASINRYCAGVGCGANTDEFRVTFLDTTLLCQCPPTSSLLNGTRPGAVILSRKLGVGRYQISSGAGLYTSVGASTCRATLSSQSISSLHHSHWVCSWRL